MSILTTHAAAGLMRVLHRLAIPLLALETLGLVGLVASWSVAGIAAIVLTVVVVVIRALRRASRQIDTILRDELMAAGADAAERDVESVV